MSPQDYPPVIVEPAPRYLTRDDWDHDPHRHNGDVHYRLYMSHRGNQPVVICVQDFDYLDYDARRIMSTDAWATETEAERAYAALLPKIAKAEAALPTSMDPDMRARLIAAAVREPDGYGDLYAQFAAGAHRVGYRFQSTGDDVRPEEETPRRLPPVRGELVRRDDDEDGD